MKEKTIGSNVAVVGGGLAGLTAANYLARAGFSVTLFEKSRSVGGRAKTDAEQGFHFNLGPHALYAAARLSGFCASWEGGFMGNRQPRRAALRLIAAPSTRCRSARFRCLLPGY